MVEVIGSGRFHEFPSLLFDLSDHNFQWSRFATYLRMTLRIPKKVAFVERLVFSAIAGKVCHHSEESLLVLCNLQSSHVKVKNRLHMPAWKRR
jgi:hypothetical protein